MRDDVQVYAGITRLGLPSVEKRESREWMCKRSNNCSGRHSICGRYEEWNEEGRRRDCDIERRCAEIETAIGMIRRILTRGSQC
jgi:hypothetical protein